MLCQDVESVVGQGLSSRQFEGLQGALVSQRKLFYQFLHHLIGPDLGPRALRFHRDLGRMKPPVLGLGFVNNQQTDCTRVCRAFLIHRMHRMQRGTSVTPIKVPILLTKKVFRNITPSKGKEKRVGEKGGLLHPDRA